MSSTPEDDKLREASRTPAYRKVKRVAPEQSPVTPAGKEPDPDLGHELIRKERYTSAEFMQLEWERIWTKVWLLGAIESDLREPGDFVATEIGRESVLIVRAHRQALHAQLTQGADQVCAVQVAGGLPGDDHDLAGDRCLRRRGHREGQKRGYGSRGAGW